MNRVTLNISMAVLILVLVHSAAHAFRLPATGLTKCYDVAGNIIPCAGTGQDGAYIINPMSFTDNSNGTITDNNTGLMWQKCTVGQNNDASCSGPFLTYNWYYATGTPDTEYNPSPVNLCALSLGGHGDWRLPTKKELITIVDFSGSSPVVNPAYFPHTAGLVYWSSPAYAPSTDKAWFESFGNGNIYVNWKYLGGTVRCVRGGQTPQSLSDNNDGTVTDSRTGLVWQQSEAEGGGRTWNAALSYCNTSNLASQTDWRLPNIKELESLTDDSQFSAAIDKTKFTSANASGYWSSTSINNPPGYAWSVDFYDGSAQVHDMNNNSSVRCVRGGQSGPLGNFLRLMRGSSPVNVYATFSDAYAAATDGDVIQARAVVSPLENVTFASASNEVVAIDGGYDNSFTSVTGMTTLSGSMTIGSGTSLTIDNLIIK